MGSSRHKSPHQAKAWRVLRSAHLAVPNDAVCIFSYEKISNCKINLSSEEKNRECKMGWSHHTSHSKNQQLECENTRYRDFLNQFASFFFFFFHCTFCQGLDYRRCLPVTVWALGNKKNAIVHLACRPTHCCRWLTCLTEHPHLVWQLRLTYTIFFLESSTKSDPQTPWLKVPGRFLFTPHDHDNYEGNRQGVHVPVMQ